MPAPTAISSPGVRKRRNRRTDSTGTGVRNGSESARLRGCALRTSAMCLSARTPRTYRRPSRASGLPAPPASIRCWFPRCWRWTASGRHRPCSPRLCMSRHCTIPTCSRTSCGVESARVSVAHPPIGISPAVGFKGGGTAKSRWSTISSSDSGSGFEK